MDERLKFVARRLAGEPMAELCREFGISRKTGYKIFDRYKDCGVEGLTDRSRRPYRYAHQLPFQVENYILNVKNEHPSWGARKIRERLFRRFSGIKIPAKSTIHAVLDRHGLVEHRTRSRHRAQGTALSMGNTPNQLWCTDYKGEFLLGNRQYCYPLTVTDHASRYLLCCEALSSNREDYAFTVFERLFKERGLPANMRSDNGVPFASAHALFNLSKLAVWWLRLGIGIERIKPGHPQQNGRHERMHLALKKETTKPAGANFLQQQAKFDDFIEIFNHQRPHEALDMKCPAEVYQPSPRPYKGLPDIDYPLHDKVIVVTNCGRICLRQSIVELVDTIRNRTLNLALELQAELGEQDLRKITPAESAQIDRTINTYIFGGTNVFASGQSQVNANISSNQRIINVGNRTDLDTVLKSSGLSNDDLEQLSQAEQQDGHQKMGSGVKTWIKKTAPKVLAGGVKIGTEVGQKLLTDWLMQYYGIHH